MFCIRGDSEWILLHLDLSKEQFIQDRLKGVLYETFELVGHCRNVISLVISFAADSIAGPADLFKASNVVC